MKEISTVGVGKHDNRILLFVGRTRRKTQYTAEGQTYTISMTMNAKYTYDNVQPIVAPSDAASYTEADFDDMLG